ncbi:MAG: hypothetical protein RMX68_010255 [Aulosira sp. ZfuVER01]|nr:hypothetical protein [Aulosira sp. ZfuVER01]MDZ8002238.1 hypothetical protein [Aulosira sp. DedVER01a]MDZ8055704.1 hypothetical protein [Aulosira sp. ZfuCHP01]
MTLRIKATREEFQAACANGCVYGEIKGKRGLYAYAELGSEQEYIQSPKDNPITDYRIFTGCDVYFAKTQEQLANGDFEAEYLPNVTIIIYC